MHNEIAKVDSNSSFIELLARAKYEDLPKYYNEADIFVACSLCESFGLPLKEALVNQCNIVYQKLGVFDEIFTDFAPTKKFMSYENINTDFVIKLENFIHNKTNNNNTEIDEKQFWGRCVDNTFIYINKKGKYVQK